MLLRGKRIEENYVGASWSDKIESKHSTISVKEKAWKTLHFTVRSFKFVSGGQYFLYASDSLDKCERIFSQ